jgi:hypothetical protein
MERYGTIWNDIELERSGTFVNVRRTFRQESYERPVLYTGRPRVWYLVQSMFLSKYQVPSGALTFFGPRNGVFVP